MVGHRGGVGGLGFDSPSRLAARELGAPGSGCRMSVLVPGTNLLGSLYTRSQGQG
jgi:hypothetical protein